MKLFKALINSKIYISLAAVFLTIETIIQLGMQPEWHPYLFIIFFATFWEYNFNRLIIVFTEKEALNSQKYIWVKENLKLFFILLSVSLVGFIYFAFLAKVEVLMALAPIAIVTLFYSTPVFKNKGNIFILREIPYLKIFLIAAVWSTATITLPVIQSNGLFSKTDIIIMLVERFFFVFSLAIPFDIRDIEIDKLAGIKTIPLLFNEKRAIALSYISILIFFLVSLYHYREPNYFFMTLALSISSLTTFIFLSVKKIRNLPYYHYGVLDGSMLLQGFLVLIFYYFLK